MIWIVQKYQNKVSLHLMTWNLCVLPSNFDGNNYQGNYIGEAYQNDGEEMVNYKRHQRH